MRLIKSLSGLMFTASVFILITQSVLAETDGGNSVDIGDKRKSISTILQLSEVELPQTNAALLLTQNPGAEAIVEVIGVRINQTEKGVEVILETAKGDALKPVQKNEGNKLIIDIPNSQLRYEGGDIFRQEKPFAGIAEVLVVNQDNNTIQVTLTGETGLPIVELFDGDEGLIFGVTPAAVTQQSQTPPVEEKPASETPQEQPSAETDEPIELVVTGEQDGYRVPNTTTGTRTDTPLRDIPQSIQIIPQQVLRDQRADLGSALLNAPSVRNAAPTNFDSVRIQTRGFVSAPALDGIIPGGFNGARVNVGPDLTGIERIEVLQGPSSVLFGSSPPGGTVNFITKQPLRDPYYFAEATVGSFNFYRGEIDLSGPLDDDKKVLYRLNASYRDQEFFTELGRTRNLVIAPVVSAALGENTNLSFGGIYKDISFNADFGLPAVGTVLPNPNGRIPRNRMTNEGSTNVVQGRIGYTLDHKFSENWSVSNTFRYENINDVSTGYFPLGLEPDNRTQTRFYFADDGQEHDYKMVTNIIGKFSTGSIQHQLLIGIDVGRYENTSSSQEREAASIDLFNPIFGQPIGTEVTFEDRSRRALDSFGIVLQDQITLADNLKILLSGRFDTFTETNQNLIGNTETSQSLSAFSPRLGIVYQPIAPISLYANYSRAFEPAIGRTRDQSLFDPTRGTQYEVGVKADLSDRLSTTLAFYEITRSNVLTPDPVDDRFSVQTAEQRSRGIELSFAGEILPGWNVFASYAYNDARTTESNIPDEVGKRLSRTSPHAASLWTTYQIQKGDLQGLGVGLGLFYVGDRAGDNANTFEIPSYLTTDASIFYKQDRFRAAINIKNLFDVEYFESSFNRNRVHIGAPFTVQGTISWTF